MGMKVASLFSGAGGLDRGFEDAGFEVVWANEFDSSIWETFEYNFPSTFLDKRSVLDVSSDDIPEVDGLIGGPPCQSWSVAGASRGIRDSRGQLFLEYVRILREKQPKFFLAENVRGILRPTHSEAFREILRLFEACGYDVYFKLLNAVDFEVPEDRQRVIIVGFRKDLKVTFRFPTPCQSVVTLRDAIGDLGRPIAMEDRGKNFSELSHEYLVGGFSPRFMSRNRVRGWDEASFTIQAGARHIPIHPSAPPMLRVASDKFVFLPGYESLYRRFSVRECARIQTFTDDFIFRYNRISDGYKMVGNAVPVLFAEYLALAVKSALTGENGCV